MPLCFYSLDELINLLPRRKLKHPANVVAELKIAETVLSAGRLRQEGSERPSQTHGGLQLAQNEAISA